MGAGLLAVGFNAEAAQAYSGALQLQPSNLDALRGLGHARILLGQPQFAITQYQTALSIAPNDIRSLNGLGVAQDMTGDHTAAQKTYHQVLTLARPTSRRRTIWRSPWPWPATMPAPSRSWRT